MQKPGFLCFETASSASRMGVWRSLFMNESDNQAVRQ